MNISRIDILENEILDKYPEILENYLLIDKSTKQNIKWATDNYTHLGEDYYFDKPIKPELITGINGNLIMPRVYKDKVLQQARSKEMAEVFTPSWVCNAQNNLIDNSWFGRENVFNFEKNIEGKRTWITSSDKIIFPEGKTWKHYIRDTRLEITCGEAPYIVSRYDTTTGEYIEVQNRIGLLDRKLRVINENIDNTGEWLKYAQIAYENIYAYEFQGDSLLLAREAILYTFIDNYIFKFGKEPLLKSIKYIAYIIAWNIWQMDGLKFVIPNTCNSILGYDMYGSPIYKDCYACKNNQIKGHVGIKSVIKNWKNKGEKKEFIALIN